MTVCFFGIYDPSYSRSRILMEGLRQNGCRVLECRADPRLHRGVAKYRELYRQFKKLPERPDAVIVAFPGHTLVWLAKLLFRQPLVFDAFVSLWDSNVFDRKVHAKWGRGLLDCFWDWSSCALAQTVLLDTQAHIEYFVRSYRLPRHKFLRILVGANEQVFYPREAALPDEFTVHFHGTFIPLQGISHILDAAAILRNENIRFRVVGKGQEYAVLKQKAEGLRLENVEFVGQVPLERLPGYIANSHVCLGIFGASEKTQRVIPNKVYEQLAMGRAIITADTPAVRELEEFGQLPLRLVPVADSAAIASVVRELCHNAAGREQLGRDTRAFFEANLTAHKITRELADLLNNGASL